jgi:hypothetical protein
LSPSAANPDQKHRRPTTDFAVNRAIHAVATAEGLAAAANNQTTT